VLVLASVSLALSSLVGGLSHGILVYLVAGAMWGIFFSLYQGTYDTIVYDLLFETEGNSNKFQRYYGRVNVVDSIALVLGSLPHREATSSTSVTRQGLTFSFLSQ
jgi:hypothetical protein